MDRYCAKLAREEYDEKVWGINFNAFGVGGLKGEEEVRKYQAWREDAMKTFDGCGVYIYPHWALHITVGKGFVADKWLGECFAGTPARFTDEKKPNNLIEQKWVEKLKQ